MNSVHAFCPPDSLSTVTGDSDDLAAARHGDADAFGRLIAARSRRLSRLARSIVGDADADDVAQESWIACWRHLHQLDDPAKFDSWLLRIAYRTAIGRARWLRLRAAVWPRLDDARGAGEDPGARDPEGDVLVWQVLSRLPPRQRAVLQLTVIEGMTDTEIAAVLAIRPGSVRAHRRRAREAVDTWWNRGNGQGG